MFVKKPMNKIFVDTNMRVYAIDEDSQFYQRAQKFPLDTKFDLYTSSKNLIEFLTVVTRNPVISLSSEEAWSSVNDYINLLKGILYPTKSSFVKLKELMEKYRPVGLKIHDFEIAGISLASKIEVIATFKIKDFRDITEIKVIEL